MISVKKKNNKLIFEEITNTKQEIIRAFIKARDEKETSNLDGDVAIKNLIDSFKQLNIQPLDAIKQITADEVDSRFYMDSVQLHNAMAKFLGNSEQEISVDAFERFPSIGHDPYQVPSGNKAEDEETRSLDKQMDVRGKQVKNLKGGISEDKMTFTREKIKQIIMEEIQKVLEGEDQEEKDEEWDEDTEEFQKWPKGKDIEPEDVEDKEEG